MLGGRWIWSGQATQRIEDRMMREAAACERAPQKPRPSLRAPMPSPDDLGLFFSGVCTISAVEPFSDGCMSSGLEVIKRSARSIGDSGKVLDPLSSARESC